MELRQILFDWLRCVNDWEMVWAGRGGFLQPPDFDLKAVLGEGATAARTSTPSVSSLFPPHGTVLKQAYWVRCRYWMDRGFFLLEPKSWVSSLNILVWKMLLKPFFHENRDSSFVACMAILWCENQASTNTREA